MERSQKSLSPHVRVLLLDFCPTMGPEAAREPKAALGCSAESGAAPGAGLAWQLGALSWPG